jgi:hypothetical protein
VLTRLSVFNIILSSTAHAEADAFFVFTLLMADIRDHFVRTLDSDDLNGINATMSRLNKRLKLYARDQWEDMVRKNDILSSL